jgi:hypothetical protein
MMHSNGLFNSGSSVSRVKLLKHCLTDSCSGFYLYRISRRYVDFFYKLDLKKMLEISPLRVSDNLLSFDIYFIIYIYALIIRVQISDLK